MKKSTFFLLLAFGMIAPVTEAQFPPWKLYFQNEEDSGIITYVTQIGARRYFVGKFTKSYIYDDNGTLTKTITGLNNTLCYDPISGWQTAGDAPLPPKNTVQYINKLNGPEILYTSGDFPFKRKNFKTNVFEPVPIVPYYNGNDIVYTTAWEGSQILLIGGIQGFVTRWDTISNTLTPLYNGFYPKQVKQLGSTFFLGSQSMTENFEPFVFIATVETGDSTVNRNAYPKFSGNQFEKFTFYSKDDFYVAVKKGLKVEIQHYDKGTVTVVLRCKVVHTGGATIKLLEHMGDHILIAGAIEEIDGKYVDGRGTIVDYNRKTGEISTFSDTPAGNIYDIRGFFSLENPDGTIDLVATTNYFGTYILKNAQTSLPVKMASFAGEQDNGGTRLVWTTASEQNVKEFVIERRTEGTPFTPIGKVVATNSATGHRYEFTDKSIDVAPTYYRLSIVDKNGTITYSSILLFKKKGEVKITLSPNPVHSTAVLTFTSLKNERVEITIYTATGIRVKNIKIDALKGINTQLLSLQECAQGKHYLTITSSERMKPHPFLISK